MNESHVSRFKSLIVDRLSDFFDFATDDEADASLEVAIDDLRARLGKAIAERYRLSKEWAALDSNGEDFTQKAETAIAAGREDLARAALAQKQLLEEQDAALTRTLAAFDDEITTLEALLRDVKDAENSSAISNAQIERLQQLINEARQTLEGER